jgi:hypothetical protein
MRYTSRYSLVSPCLLVRLWLLSLSQVPGWTREPAVVYLMDVVLRSAFFHADAREMALQVLQQFHQVVDLVLSSGV